LNRFRKILIKQAPLFLINKFNSHILVFFCLFLSSIKNHRLLYCIPYLQFVYIFFSKAFLASTGVFFFYSGHLKPSCSQLLFETVALMEKPDMSQSLGRRLLQHMVEKDRSAEPALQYYFAQDAQTGFQNPYPQPDVNFHLGYFPLHLQSIKQNPNFPDVLQNLARQFFAALRHRTEPENKQIKHIHVLFWCNQGCRGSVAFCRLLQVAVRAWGWQSPCCMPVTDPMPHMYIYIYVIIPFA
jgi:hypothetical protein